MNIEEIRNHKWKISNELKIRKYDVANIAELEQETHFNILKIGDDGKFKPNVLVNSSINSDFINFAKSEFFFLEEVGISNHERNKGFILTIKGTLQSNALTVRKKKTFVSDEEKRKRAESARARFTKIRSLAKQ